MDQVSVAQNPTGTQSGVTFNSITNSLLALLDGGVNVYKAIANKTNNASGVVAADQKAPTQQLISTEQRATYFGFTQNQLIGAAAVLTGVLVVSMVLRRGK